MMKIRYWNIFRRLSLVQKFSAAVILMIVIVMATVSILIISHQRNVLTTEMDSNHRVVVRGLAKDAVEPLLLMDPLRLDDLIRTTVQTPGCISVGVLDKNNRVVAHTDRKLLGQTLSLGPPNESADSVKRGEEYIRDVPASGIKEILIPVMVGYEVIGTVVGGFSRQNSELVIDNAMGSLKRYLSLIALLVMLIGIWGAFSLARLLATPMRRLKDNMEVVQKGNLDIEVMNDHLLICKDVFRCDEKQCPAYGKTRCWTIAHTLCPARSSGDPLQKIHSCKNCVVYQESCGDEVGELVEVFNQMVGDLRQNLRKLAEANDEKCRLERLSVIGQVAAGVAHEINNPLGGMKLCFNNLTSTEMDDAVKQEHIAVINAGIDRIQSIVRQLLDFSKHSALTLAPSSLNRILENVLKLAEYTIERKGIEIVKDLSPDLPETMADVHKLEQVFLNLLINAMQAMDGKGGVLTLRTWRQGNHCAASVTDTGTGIAQELIPKIFDPFFTTKEVGQGTGLGLSVSKAIVEQHRGEITVKSSGAGTTVIVRIPIAL
jgi:two-component system sensor histidine kinase HydH